MADSFAPRSPRSGQGARLRLAVLRERYPRLGGGLVAVLAATPALLIFRGFTVDDALVSARMATHLAQGSGYRFNPSGPEVDAVTPLGWAHLLALGGPASPLDMLERGRVLGAVGWLGAVAMLGVLLARSSALGRGTALVLLALSTPAAAWATSGMETGLVTLFSTLALASGPGGALAGGIAAAARPELVPFASVLAVGGAVLIPAEPRRRAALVLTALLLCLGPAFAVALVRNAWFGTSAPLALSAKPPDLWPGLKYALAAALFSGPVLLLIAPFALARSQPVLVRTTLAVVVHFAAIALAGGDWMPLYRLAVPVLPAVLFAGAELARSTTVRWHAVRVTLGVVVSLVVAVFGAWPARGVLRDRVEVTDQLRVALRGARVTTTLDAGVVGASTDGSILDLAGVTDPSIATLSGGHGSKRVPEGLVESRGVDHAVLLLRPGTRAAVPWQESAFARPVEARLASFSTMDDFHLVADLPVGRTPYRYLVVARPRDVAK